jgi:outer membrane protein OmpA-like peptidoglycan-associated protein
MNHEEEFNVEGYEQAFKNEPLFEDLDYQDDPPPAGKPAGNQAYEEQYEDEDLEAENFPEPAATGGGGGKQGNSKMRMYVLGGVGALVVAFGGTYFLAPDVFGDMPAQLMSTLTGAEAPAEPAPDPVVAKPHRKPTKPAGDMAAKPAGDEAAPAPDPAKPRPHANKPGANKPAAKPVETAAKPADGWAESAKTDGAEFKPAPPMKPKANKPAAKPAAVAAALDAPEAKPMPKKPVAKPVATAKKPPAKPVAAAAAAGAKPSAAAAPSATTAVAFQRGSYWVSASEVERLWAFSSHAKSSGGQFTVESWVGSEKNGLELSRKRANRVAELLQKNTAPNAYKVTVKVHGTSAGKAAPGKVSVSYSDGSKL